MHQAILDAIDSEDTVEDTMPTIHQVYARVQTVSMIRAAHILHYVFGALDDEIYFDKTVLTVREFVRGACTESSSVKEISFWGGPDGDEDWYRGSLATMLVDRYLYNLYSEDGEPAMSYAMLESLS